MFLSATVHASSSKTCFVSLSNDLVQRLNASVKDLSKLLVLQLDWNGGQGYCSWSGDTVITRFTGFAQSSVVEIGRKFAEHNGINIGEQVVLTPLDNIPSCTRVHVDPLSVNDWEIVELHAGFIESNLLNQVRVVWKNQVVPVWINNTVFVSIRIDVLEPGASCVLLEEFTEVVIAPKQRQQLPPDTKQQENSIVEETKNDCEDINTTEDGNTSSFYTFWNYLFPSEDQCSAKRTKCSSKCTDKITGLQEKESLKLNCCRMAFTDQQINICLRTQSELTHTANQHDDHCDIFFSQQLSCIFVHPESINWNSLKCSKSHKPLCASDINSWCKMVTIRKLLSPKEKTELLNIERRKSSKDVEKDGSNPPIKLDSHSKPVPVRMVLSTEVQTGHVVLQKQLQKQLGAGAISRFQVLDNKQRPQEMKGIVLHVVTEPSKKSDSTSSEDVVTAFSTWVGERSSDDCPLLIWNGLTVSINTKENSSLELMVTVLSHAEDNKDDVKSPPYYNITASVLEHITVVVGDDKSLPKTPSLLWQMQIENAVQLSCNIHDLGGFTELFNKCLHHLSICLGPSHLCGGLTSGLSNGAVLIHGSGIHAGQGCGKTSLGHALCRELQQYPTEAHVVYIDCIPLRGKRVETIQRCWQQAFLEAAWYQPSVILLDNLDHVIAAPSLTQEIGGEGLYRLRLVQVFKDLITSAIENKSKIGVIATSRSRDCLHGDVQSGRGVHIFQCCVELGPLNQSQRCDVLAKLIIKKYPGINCDELEKLVKFISRKCEGFSPKDLSALVDRALHFSFVRRTSDSQGSLSLDDFSKALTGFSPASLRGIELHKPSQQTWLDVGGLHDVKKSLEETLLWPTKYAGLFSKCPLRLRSGLLLYGSPGSGKTLLAGVIANESGLNFISIKGPELLSKYIGASEQAVRDVFSRAQTAKPCILFFDEFDALAPRRGHDSTGVTDRVVNQLLTQLDGVEGLDGVFVLAATSRPGLIDPALLRPGRLDKCVYCPMPNKSDRLEILKALTRNISLAEDVDLSSIAERCEDFTGADLKALLYNAQLECIHRKTSKLKLYGSILGETEDDNVTGGLGNVDVTAENGVITICQADIDKAVTTMRPSVSPKERLMYENMFDSFTRSRGNSFNKNIPFDGKTTLA